MAKRAALRRGALLLAAFLLSPPPALAADESDIQLWPTAQINHGLGKNFGAHFQARGRFDQNVSETKDYLLRPFVSWLPGKGFTFDLGYDYLHSFSSSTEHRIWQAAQHHFQWRKLSIANRIRLDQRFVEDVDGVVVRFRYRLRTTRKIGDTNWYGVISDEVFTNVNDQGAGPISGFEQNRLRFAFGNNFMKRLRVESGYEYQYTQSRSGTDTDIHMFFVEFSIDTGDRRLFGWAPR
jgi:hypothetical protein